MFLELITAGALRNVSSIILKFKDKDTYQSTAIVGISLIQTNNLVF